MGILFSNQHINIAAINDVIAITALLNSAYRGETSKKGWTTEAHLIDGDTRSTAEDVQQVMEKSGSIFLTYTAEN